MRDMRVRTEEAQLVNLAILVCEELERAVREVAVERRDVSEERQLGRRRDWGRHRGQRGRV